MLVMCSVLIYSPGKTFTFALGRVQILYVADPELVREFNLCKSLDLGKPAYLQKERGPLLGKGLITANREMWSHERKTITPTLYIDKVKVYIRFKRNYFLYIDLFPILSIFVFILV